MKDLVDDVLRIQDGVADRFGVEVDLVDATLAERSENRPVLGHVLTQDPDNGRRVDHAAPRLPFPGTPVGFTMVTLIVPLRFNEETLRTSY